MICPTQSRSAPQLNTPLKFVGLWFELLSGKVFFRGFVVRCCDESIIGMVLLFPGNEPITNS